MTKDSRLGANPLSWVDPNASTKDPVVSVSSTTVSTPPAASTEMGKEQNELDGIFRPADNITKEDLMGKSKVKIKQTLDTTQVVNHLKDLANSLEAGTIRAENGEESVTLIVGESMEFEMKLSRKKDKAKCSLELEWVDDGTNPESFKIGD